MVGCVGGGAPCYFLLGHKFRLTYLAFLTSPGWVAGARQPWNQAKVHVWALHLTFAGVGGLSATCFSVVSGWSRGAVVWKLSVFLGCYSSSISPFLLLVSRFLFVCLFIFIQTLILFKLLFKFFQKFEIHYGDSFGLFFPGFAQLLLSVRVCLLPNL